MIIITGDVHFYDKHNWEQRRGGSEVLSAQKYLRILKKYGLSSTIYINGKCLEQEKEEVKSLLDFDVEFGGHTYDNFGNCGKLKGYAYRKIWGCIYGSRSYQMKDIKKTKSAFEKFGLKMTSWRTHAFGSNEITFELLKRVGVMYVSDLLGMQKPFNSNGIIHLPINIPPDQNTIAYGFLSPRNRDPFASCTKGRIEPEEWFDILKKRVFKNEKENTPSILLVHPATMSVLDDFSLFEKIAKFLSVYKSCKVSEFRLNN